MVTIDMAFMIIFIIQTGVGGLGNSLLLGHYIFTYLNGHRLKPIDLLISHLAFVNTAVLFFKGIPQAMAAFGVSNFLDDTGCKLVIYLHRVARSLSLFTTSFLSGFQAITINSRSATCVNFKARMPKFIVPSCFLFWAFSLLTHGTILLYIRGPRDSRNSTKRNVYIYCSSFYTSGNISVFTVITSLLDMVHVGIMVWTSGFMVLILYRHHQQTHYIHQNNFTPGGAPETRAIQTVLLLVSMFVFFYMINSVMSGYMNFFKPSPWFVHTSAFLAACYSACSPFVFIMSNSQVLRYCVTFWQRIKAPILTLALG
ncbi:vomeronasal 1 receptor monDomV1R1251 [Monodelphis domestica]|uniref:Vomeronasal type-1 receptor n=1 Tax=Monodelphis domestica TaxID=13616 RepID=A0A5F8GZY1_MONDO|nr:vomeronasal 1 receptor monDomV1R1251 [Monodelphis domestica]